MWGISTIGGQAFFFLPGVAGEDTGGGSNGLNDLNVLSAVRRLAKQRR